MKPKKEWRVFETEVSSKKCPGCNWSATSFYGIGPTKEAAKLNYKSEADEEYGAGLCGECLAELLATEDYIITKCRKLRR